LVTVAEAKDRRYNVLELAPIETLERVGYRIRHKATIS
jgi:hypothetical protein